MNVLEVTAVGKSYRKYSSEFKRVLTWFNLPFKPTEEHWVLQNISFNVQAGEAVGIVGQNGAGKSTLLKMITGIVQPSSGVITVTGKIAAILELGMGFNPEFTGRRNAFHGLSMMGLNRTEIKKVMPELEAFADIGAYFDEPVRAYSSGMQVRVAFAIATAFRSDILIVDEALAVGDAAFQRKCFQRIETFQHAGTALLYVSHEIESIKKICDSAIYIKEGLLEKKGTAKDVCDVYEKHIFGFTQYNSKTENKSNNKTNHSANFDPSIQPSKPLIYGNGKAKILNLAIQDSDNKKINVVSSDQDFKVCFDIHFLEKEVMDCLVNLQVKTTDGVVIYGVNSRHFKKNISLVKTSKVKICFNLENRLAPGFYFFNIGVKKINATSEDFFVRLVDTLILKVVDRENSTVARGLIDMRASLQIEAI